MRWWSMLLLVVAATAGEVRPTLHLTSERPWYRPGETACLRVLLLDAVTRVPVDARQPVALRVRDGQGTVVWSALAHVEDGVAAAGWPVPETAGHYHVEAGVGMVAAEPRRVLVARATGTLGAATAAEFAFDRRGYAPGDTAAITVALSDRGGTPLAGAPAILRVALPDGSTREERVIADAQGRATISVAIPTGSERNDATVTALLPGDGGAVASRAIPLATARLELRAEVEGGTLIAGRPAVVVVQARSLDGQPADARGEVLDGSGTAVARFAAVHEGRARLAFTPAAGIAYRLACTAPVRQELALPAVATDGVSVLGEAVQDEGDPLRLRLEAPAGSWRVSLLRRGGVVAEAAAAGAQDLVLDPPAAGAMDVLVHDGEGRLRTQRTLFRRPRHAVALAIAAPETGTPQEQVEVSLRLTGNGDGLRGLCSLAVVEAGDEDLIEARERPPRLPEIAWLDGEVEELADPGAYLGADGASRERLALLLGVQAWRRGTPGEDGGRWRRLHGGQIPIMPALLAPALAAPLPALAVEEREMGGQGLFMAIGAGGGGAGMFGSRIGGSRKRAVALNGGSRGSENAVDAALRFLKKSQSPDGRWSAGDWPRQGIYEAPVDGVGIWTGPSADRCTTALALLAYLGAGYDHKTPNRYRATVAKGIAWLLAQTDAGRADADPVVQACATMACSEAYAMTADPELRAPTQAMIGRLLAMQHARGGWAASGEAGDARIDAVASTWAVMALKSGYAGGLSVGDGLEHAQAFLRRAFAAANPDTKPIKANPYTASGAFPGVFDAATGTAHQPERSHAGAVMAVFLGHRVGDPLLEGLAGRIADQPPGAPPMDPQAVYWGTLAMIQYGGGRWAWWNAQLRDHLVALQRREPGFDGSYDPLVFGDTGLRWGRLVTTVHCTLALEVYYRYAEIRRDRTPSPRFADQRSLAAPGDATAEHPPGTLAWWAGEPTAADGTVTLRLPAALRGRRLTLRADALDASGGFAAAQRALEIRAAAEVLARLPSRLLAGDRWEVPVSGRGSEAARCTATGPLRTVLAGGRLAITAAGPGAAALRLEAAGANPLLASVPVLPVGSTWSEGGQQLGSGRIVLPPDLETLDGLRTSIQVETGISRMLTDVHAAFTRQPHGCFEQTSSTSHPLAVSCLRRRQNGLADDAGIGHLAAAARRLQGFACASGGFSMFGRDPGDAVLTAYGLRQLRLLGRLVPVDAALLARQRDWLLTQRDPDGRFRSGAASCDAALCQVQIAAELGADCPPADRQRAYADAGRLGTVYALALAARLAREAGEPALGAGLLAKVARLPDGGVSVPGSSPWRHGAAIEAVALCVQGDLAEGRHEQARSGLAWLGVRRCGPAWDITQANVLAIEAFAAAEPLLPPPGRSQLRVSQGGRELARLDLDPARPLAGLDLRPEARGGPLEVVVGGDALLWRWQATAQVARPPDARDAPLSLALALPARLAVGQPCELVATVRAREGVYAPLLRLGIPAGLEPRPEALDRLVRAGRIAHWDALDGELRLYGERLEAGAAWEVPVSCLAIAAGRFAAPPSCALPYYEPARTAWQAVGPVEIAP